MNEHATILVLISTTRTISSVSGNTFFNRPIFHNIKNKLSSFSTTKVLSKSLHIQSSTWYAAATCTSTCETNCSKYAILAIERTCDIIPKMLWFPTIPLKQVLTSPPVNKYARVKTM